jgi:hypothetical protein
VVSSGKPDWIDAWPGLIRVVEQFKRQTTTVQPTRHCQSDLKVKQTDSFRPAEHIHSSQVEPRLFQLGQYRSDFFEGVEDCSDSLQRIPVCRGAGSRRRWSVGRDRAGFLVRIGESGDMRNGTGLVKGAVDPGPDAGCGDGFSGVRDRVTVSFAAAENRVVSRSCAAWESDPGAL